MFYLPYLLSCLFTCQWREIKFTVIVVPLSFLILHTLAFPEGILWVCWYLILLGEGAIHFQWQRTSDPLKASNKSLISCLLGSIPLTIIKHLTTVILISNYWFFKIVAHSRGENSYFKSQEFHRIASKTLTHLASSFTDL